MLPSSRSRYAPGLRPARLREYLTEAEVEKLIDAARKRGRNGARDAAAILLAYRHELRAAELCQRRWSQIELRHGRLHVNQAKGEVESVHPLHGPELRALRPFTVHPHMLRHSTGYKLANDGQDTRSLVHYLWHRNLQSTARYTALAPDRIARFWED